MSSYCENIFHYNRKLVDYKFVARKLVARKLVARKLVARKLVDRILLCFAFSHFVIKRRAKQKTFQFLSKYLNK